MNRRMRASPWILVLLMLLVVVSFPYSVWRTRVNAERFSRAAENLEIGKASADDVLKLIKSSRGKIDGASFLLSKEGDGTWAVDFENAWLHRLRLAPLVVFTCRFGIKDYKLQNRSIAMVSYGSRDVNAGAFVHEDLTTEWANQVAVRPEEKYFRITSGYPVRYTGVLVTPDAPTDLRRLAYSFNYTCLSKLGGCKTHEEMLPVLAWRLP